LAVIVRASSGGVAAAGTAVERVGGHVVRPLRLIGAVAANVSADSVGALARLP
jgi:hypothetical protein